MARYRQGLGDVSKGRHAAESAQDEAPALGQQAPGPRAKRPAPKNIKGLAQTGSEKRK